MTSQPGFQTITMHILHNISQNNDNQIIKFGQLIEHSKRNIFLQKLCRKWGSVTRQVDCSLLDCSLVD